MSSTATGNGQGVIRAARSGLSLRAADQAGGMPTLFGHFAVFDRWAEIDSWLEGSFLERIAPGAFRKTIRENRGQVKVLFQHGADPQIGDKPLGRLARLEEDSLGGYYEVPLLDTSYNRELLPGLQADLYGASFRFKVLREELVDAPEASEENPRGLAERTIKEAQLYELGPVTFPAYPEASAGVRSLTDRFLFEAIERHPDRFRALLEARMDVEDIGTLAQMIQLGAAYIDEQDEPGDQPNIPVMEEILGRLAGLLGGETVEDEPPEDEDERSTTTDAATARTSGRKPDAATPRTSDTWPHLSDTEWEGLTWSQ
jgi:HK97 family phage prohead protease